MDFSYFHPALPVQIAGGDFGLIDVVFTDPDRRAVIDVNASREDRLVEVRYFDKKQFHLPIMQAEMDANPQLVQNDGY